MVLTGTYEHIIDVKNRLAIPADVRAQIAQSGRSKGPVYLYVTPGEGPWLCLYTEDGFEKRAAELDRSTLKTERLLEYEELFFSHATRIELDAQGRVLLPEWMLKMKELKGEVVLLGVRDHLRIRDRAAWKQHVQQVLSRPDIPSPFRNPRLAMASEGPGPSAPQPANPGT